jgi:hypothetical protein
MDSYMKDHEGMFHQQTSKKIPSKLFVGKPLASSNSLGWQQ